jgi:hypothetical protein
MLRLFHEFVGAVAGLLALSLFFTCAVRGEEALGTPAPPPNPVSGANLPPGTLMEFISKTSPYEFWLACVIMLFGLGVLFLYLWGIRNIDGRRPEDVSRSLIVIFVITGSLVLITVGYSTEQIAPAFGLFGTIIGYMLGRMSQSNAPGSSPPGRPDPDVDPNSPTPDGSIKRVGS